MFYAFVMFPLAAHWRRGQRGSEDAEDAGADAEAAAEATEADAEAENEGKGEKEEGDFPKEIVTIKGWRNVLPSGVVSSSTVMYTEIVVVLGPLVPLLTPLSLISSLCSLFTFRICDADHGLVIKGKPARCGPTCRSNTFIIRVNLKLTATRNSHNHRSPGFLSIMALLGQVVASIYFLEARDNAGRLVGHELVVTTAICCAVVVTLVTFFGELKWGNELARTISWVNSDSSDGHPRSASDNQVALMQPAMMPRSMSRAGKGAV